MIGRKVAGPLMLPGVVHCSGEVAGHSFRTTVGSYRASIRFPRRRHQPTRENYSRPLDPPVGGGFWRHIDWGKTYQWPDLDFATRHVLVVFDMDPSATERASSLVDSMDQSASAWAHRFCSGLELLTEKLIVGAPPELVPGGERDFRFVTGARGERVGRRVVSLTINAQPEGATLDDIQRSVRFASKSVEPLLSHRLLRDAYGARRWGQNRRAVIEACTAAEVALAEWLRQRMTARGLRDSESTAVSRVAEGLRRRAELAEKFGFSLPSAAQVSQLANVRNRSVHGGYHPNAAETSKAITSGAEIVRTAFPDPLATR